MTFPRVIFLDLDGTLLRSDKTLSVKTTDALMEMRKRNALIAFSSARAEEAMTEYIGAIKPDIVISNGGALAKVGDKVICSHKLSASDVRHIIARCFSVSGGKCEITIQTENAHYWNYKEKPDGAYSGSVYNDFSDFSEPAYKVTAEVENESDASAIAGEISSCSVSGFRGEIWRRFAAACATKENAVKEVCKALGIPRDEAMAFGDDENDIGTLKFCGMGVAMQNALPEVKAAAGYVTGYTNDDDGIAEFLRKYFLNDGDYETIS